MKKLINVRVFLFAAAGFAVGILCGCLLLYGRYIYAALPAVSVLSVFVFLCVKNKKFASASFITLIFMLSGFAVFRLRYITLCNTEKNCENVTLRGRVTDGGKKEENYSLLYLENCVILSDESNDGETLKGKVRVFITGDADADTGCVVTVKGTLNSLYIFKDKIDSNPVRSLTYYELTEAKLVKTEKGKMRLDEKCRSYVLNVFREYMPDSYGTAYALITGDKTAMAEGDRTAFRQSGIAHVLAVSGLHVGFLSGVLGFVLRKLRVPPIVRPALLIAPLTFYAYLCGFPPSVVRALVMTAAVSVNEALFSSSDLLTSLSIAALVLLAADPVYLFDAGFLLSFGSVFGIATFTSAANRFLKKRAVPRFARGLFNSVALSLGAVSGTFCTAAYFYGEISPIGVLFNVAAIPLVTVAFILCFVGLIPSFFGYVLFVPDKLLLLLGATACGISSLPLSSVAVGSFGMGALVAGIWLFAVGGYVNIKGKFKIIAHCVLALTFAVFSAAALVPKNTSASVTAAAVYGKGSCIVATDDLGNAAVLCDFENDSQAFAASDVLKGKRINSLSLYFGDFSRCSPSALQTFSSCAAEISRVYVLGPDGNTAAEEFFASQDIRVTYLPKNLPAADGYFDVRSVYDGSIAAAVISFDGIRLASVYAEGAALDRLPDICGEVNVYVTANFSEKFAEKTQGAVVISKYQQKGGVNYGANKFGNFTIRSKGGKISVTV